MGDVGSLTIGCFTPPVVLAVKLRLVSCCPYVFQRSCGCQINFCGLILILKDESKILAHAFFLFLQMTGRFFEKIFCKCDMLKERVKNMQNVENRHCTLFLL